MRPNFLIYRNWLEREHPDIAQKDHLKEGPSVCIPYAQFSAYQNFDYQTWKIDQMPLADRTMAM